MRTWFIKVVHSDGTDYISRRSESEIRAIYQRIISSGRCWGYKVVSAELDFCP